MKIAILLPFAAMGVLALASTSCRTTGTADSEGIEEGTGDPSAETSAKDLAREKLSWGETSLGPSLR